MVWKNSENIFSVTGNFNKLTSECVFKILKLSVYKNTTQPYFGFAWQTYKLKKTKNERVSCFSSKQLQPGLLTNGRISSLCFFLLVFPTVSSLHLTKPHLYPQTPSLLKSFFSEAFKSKSYFFSKILPENPCDF